MMTAKIITLILFAFMLTGCNQDKAPVKSRADNILLKKEDETLGKAQRAADELLKKQNEALRSADEAQ